MPLAMKTIVSVFATVQKKKRDVPPDVALDEVDVALEDAGEADQLVTEGCCGAGHYFLVLLALLVLERLPGRGEERLFERLGVVAPLELVDGLEGEQPAVVEDADPVRERFRLVEVVRAEQDRRVVRLPDLADEVLDLELRARVEPGRGLVEEQEDRLRQERAGERDLLLHAPRQVLHGLVAACGREADALEDLRDPVTGLADGEPVEPGRIGQVLGRRHLLEERGLDRDAVDEPAHRAGVGQVVPEERCGSAVVQEQRREQPDQRRLARAVLAENGDALAAGHLEADSAQCLDPLAAAAQAGALAVTAAELLAQLLDFDCGHVLLQTRFAGTRRRRTSVVVSRCARRPVSTEAQHCGDHVTCGPGRTQGSG